MILQLFPAYRRLEAEMRELSDKLTEAHDELRVLRARLSEAEDRARDAMQDSLRTRERIADFLAKRTGLGTVFAAPESIPDPPRPNLAPITTGRQHARAFVEEREREFMEQVSQLNG